MGKYLTVVLGVAAIVFGMWGIVTTWPLLWIAITAIVPPLFVLGGLLAVMVGVGEIRDIFAARKTQAQAPTTPAPQRS